MKPSPWIRLMVVGTLALSPVLTAQSQAALPSRSSTTSARVIVKYRSPIGTTTALSATHRTTSLGLRLGRSLMGGATIAPQTQVVHAHGVDSQTLARELAADPQVEYAEPDQRRRAHAIPNDSFYANGQTLAGIPAKGQWYLRAPAAPALAAINAEPAWALSTGNANVVVAVLDSGIVGSHPDLLNKLVAGRDFISDPFIANDGNGWDADATDAGDWLTAAEISAHNMTSNDPCWGMDATFVADSSWHGTQVAGLIGAATNNASGMASVGQNVRIMPLRVLGKCGGWDSDIIAAMRWSVGLSVSDPVTSAALPLNPNKAHVINLSLGGPGLCSNTYNQAMAEIRATGAVVVASAGNDGLAVNSPANCPGVIAVGGLDHSGTKGDMSSLGPEITVSAPMGDCPGNTAPCGYPILSTSNPGTTTPLAYAANPTATQSASYFTSDGTLVSNVSRGTSFSAPMVAGTVGLLLSINPALTPDQIKRILQGTSRPFPAVSTAATLGGCAVPPTPSAITVASQANCHCNGDTCGTGMLDVGQAINALPSGLVFAQIDNIPAVLTTNSPIQVRGSAFRASTNGAASSAAVGCYQWSINTYGQNVASFVSASNTATPTINLWSLGRFSLTLSTFSDPQCLVPLAQTHEVLTVSATGSNTGGGTGGGTTPPPSTGPSTPPSTANSNGGLALDGLTLALFGLGLLGHGLRRRRSRHDPVKPMR
ncbi:MAG: S8 family peptidase [Leptothrix ochracea]|uniref:S8 family peptidase n=1 Tax=Leptothrix ochracea TaxID=735331 RepID=UPI0034E27ED9